MKIKIVKVNRSDETGDSLAVRAWKFSRNNDEVVHDEVLKLDLPVNEIPNIVVEIESTIIEREIIASMRDHHIWARSSRVDEPFKFEIPDSLMRLSKYSISAKKLTNKMVVDKSKGVCQDEYRMHMPLFALTKYTVSINFRSLVVLQSYFSHLASICHEPPMINIYSDASKKFVSMIKHFIVDSSFIYHNKFKEILPSVVNMENGRTGDFITYSGKMPFSLRTHLIRHRMVFMLDNLKEIALREDFHSLTLNSEMKVSVSSSVNFWSEIVSKRSCWLIHYSMWKPVIKRILKFIPETSENELPCSGNGAMCRYQKDNQARIEFKDPNSPCPIYLSYNEIKISRIHKQNISKQFISDLRPLFWTKHIGELK